CLHYSSLYLPAGVFTNFRIGYATYTPHGLSRHLECLLPSALLLSRSQALVHQLSVPPCRQYSRPARLEHQSIPRTLWPSRALLSQRAFLRLRTGLEGHIRLQDCSSREGPG